jgi:hypothetical protein
MAISSLFSLISAAKFPLVNQPRFSINLRQTKVSRSSFLANFHFMDKVLS